MTPLHDLCAGLETRSASFENPTGQKGGGGRAASPLGVGRKGDPARVIAPGEEVVLADIAGRGTIRHIWLTGPRGPRAFRGLIMRAWWDGQPHPSIECPLGDLFGFAHGFTPAFESDVHSVGARYGLNLWLPMPFVRGARLTLTNELGRPTTLFYQVDYTLGDDHPEDVGRLHVAFRRENPTTPGADFEILPRRQGRGRYLGAVIGVRPLSPGWWGEGEVKVFLDGDTDFPTVCGTGSEDYVGLSFGIQAHAFRHHGANWRERDADTDTGRVSMYRWHVPDPVVWARDIRVTIQQLGLAPGPTPTSIDDYKARLVERADDWSAAAFWYEPAPSAPLAPLPDLPARLADLPDA
ncbi:MAG: glycoside hydrolase family 172 protein [Pseudomonadota bacterium]